MPGGLVTSAGGSLVWHRSSVRTCLNYFVGLDIDKIHTSRWGRIAVAPRDSTEEENDEEENTYMMAQRGLNSSEEEEMVDDLHDM